MLVEPGNSAAGSTVTGAIRQASQATGTSFSYLLATAQVESGLNPQAGAPTSSARGLFQFVEQTWLGTMKQSGAALGYGRYADAISQTAPGRYVVADPAMRQDILKLRNNPTVNAVMAGAFTQANAAYLTQKLGRPPSEGELYIAHFLGAGGAARLIGLAARSLAAVRNVLTARYDVAARSGPHHAAPLAQAAATLGAPLSIAPDTAGIANAFAAATPAPAPTPTPTPPHRSSAQDGPMFYGLFADAGSNGPVGPLVSQLWGAPNGAH